MKLGTKSELEQAQRELVEIAQRWKGNAGRNWKECSILSLALLIRDSLEEIEQNLRNNTTLQAQKEIIQAAIEGKELEYRFRLGHEVKWTTIGPKYTLFNFDVYEYRIKSKPREGWIWCVSSNVIDYPTKESLIASFPNSGAQIIHVREIID